MQHKLQLNQQPKVDTSTLMRSTWAIRQYRDVSKSLIILLVALAVAVQARIEPGKYINECAESGLRCEHNCNNTAGSYTCHCNAGYRLTSDRQTCADINECSEGTSGCSQLCNNNNGSYTCECNQGYILASNGRTCNDIDECSPATSNCEQLCTNVIGSYICGCNEGFTLASGGHSCDDIDECEKGISGCAQICVNVVGNYACKCQTGYSLTSDERSCEDIDECKSGISECDQICVNANGSSSCECHSGYILADDGRSCYDIDECVQLPCAKQHKHTCQNIHGSYLCVCEAGYKEVVPHECQDIDECETLTNNCTGYDNMTCENTIGSYKCVLRQGVNRNSTIIAVIVCVVVGIFLIIVATVCFIKRGKTRLRNKQAAADPTTSNAELAAEAVYYNVVKITNSKSSESKTAKQRQETEVVYEGFDPNSNHTESQARETAYESLDLSNLQKENFYEPLEKQPKIYAHVYDNATNTST